MFEDTGSSDFTPLETVQAALLLSFCARRNSVLDLAQNRRWLQIAISKLQKRQAKDLIPFASEAQNRSLWLRIWWTCYLYERLDGFHPNSRTHGFSFRLNAGVMPLLTLNDFELDSISGSEPYGHFVITNLRMASIHLQKIWLATKIDEIMRSRIPTERNLSDSSAKTTSCGVLDGWHFWNAHNIQLEFDAWQKQTSNTMTTIGVENRGSFHTTVHWVSLYLLYCRVVISSYNAAMSTPNPVSLEDRSLYSIGQHIIRKFYMEIFNLAKRILDHGQVAHAHAAYPMIWMYLLTATEVFPAMEQASHSLDTPEKSKALQLPHSLDISLYKNVLETWGSVPRPAISHFPDLFHFPSPSSRSLGKQSWELSLGTIIESRDDAWDEMNTDFMLENMESLVYSPGTR